MDFATHNGKPILIVRNRFGQYKIKFEQGGELPADMSGDFTKEKDAVRAIHMYLDRTQERKVTNGKGNRREAD